MYGNISICGLATICVETSVCVGCFQLYGKIIICGFCYKLYGNNSNRGFAINTVVTSVNVGLL